MEGYVTPKATKVAFKLEATEGTAPTDAAADSILANIAPEISGFSREWFERALMIGHLGRLPPLDAGPSEPGCSIQVYGRGSGTHGTAPEIGQMLECSMGAKTLGVTGTVAASPAPTTTAATVTSATIAAGQLIDIEIGTGVYETRRVITSAAGPAITWWPPTSAAPATGANVYPGVSYIISSTQADYKSGSAFFYFPNGEKAILSGLKGNPTFTFAIRQPMVIDFAFQGIKSPVTSQTAIGYTWAPPDFLVVPPVCLGIELRVYIPALVKTGTTTTSVLLKKLDGSASYFEATDAVDKLIVDVGSSVYETKTIATWTYATQAATCTALSGAPAANAPAYIQRTICVPDTLTLNPGHAFTRIECMAATDGWISTQVSDRVPEISWSQYFKSFVDYRLLQDAAFVELWAILGITRGNKIAMCVPNLFRQNFELDLGGEFGMVNMTGSAFADGVAGNEEMYLTLM
jgi:hypothetical protein